MAVSGGKRGRQRRRTRAEERLLVVVAGPNGAGKSTFVETFLNHEDHHSGMGLAHLVSSGATNQDTLAWRWSLSWRFLAPDDPPPCFGLVEDSVPNAVDEETSHSVIIECPAESRSP
jgi:septin family protein